MGVDKSDVLKKMREAEAIYVLMSDCTRMPFVVCDPETYDDQVLIFFSEEEAMKGGQEFLKEGNPLKIFNIENKYMLPFYSSLFPAGVNGMWVGKIQKKRSSFNSQNWSEDRSRNRERNRSRIRVSRLQLCTSCRKHVSRKK